MEEEIKKNVQNMLADPEMKKISLNMLEKMAKHKYSYNFTWLGRPIIQIPQDIIALQEIIWRVKPDLIIETGIAHGGGLVFYASIMELIGGDGIVLGIDIDIREHNRIAIEKHPMYKRIKIIEGSSISKEVIKKVEELCRSRNKILVILDSSHTYNHVLNEIEIYSQLVSVGSYLVVLDTAIEDLPENMFDDRPWGKGNNPKTAVFEFLKNRNDFIIDKDLENKLIITVATDGYLKRIK